MEDRITISHWKYRQQYKNKGDPVNKSEKKQYYFMCNY